MINTAKSYGIIEINGQQIQIQLGCYYDRKLPSKKLLHSSLFQLTYKEDQVYIKLTSKSSYWYINKNIISFYKIALFCNKVGLWLGVPWMDNLTIKGRLKRFSVSPKIIIYKMSRKKKKKKKNWILS